MGTGIIYVRYNMCAFFLYLWFFLCFFIRFLLIQHILCVVFWFYESRFFLYVCSASGLTIVLEQIREPISNQYLTINIILHICILYVQNKFLLTFNIHEIARFTDQCDNGGYFSSRLSCLSLARSLDHFLSTSVSEAQARLNFIVDLEW